MLIYITDFEAVQKTRIRVLSGLKAIGFASSFKPDNTLLLVFKQYVMYISFVNVIKLKICTYYKTDMWKHSHKSDNFCNGRPYTSVHPSIAYTSVTQTYLCTLLRESRRKSR